MDDERDDVQQWLEAGGSAASPALGDSITEWLDEIHGADRLTAELTLAVARATRCPVCGAPCAPTDTPGFGTVYWRCTRGHMHATVRGRPA